METIRTLIQKHSSAIISGLVDRIESLSSMNHNLSKGQLRELFVNEVLSCFLTDQFGIGSGIIINQAGLQSKQTDILIFDKRVLPPFVSKTSLGVYPIESILGVIEVKTNLTKENILRTERNFEYLRTVICDPKYSYKQKSIGLKPICAVIGFYGIGQSQLLKADGNIWLSENLMYLTSICLVRKYSWIRTTQGGWSVCLHSAETYEETKRFIALFLDNIRTISTRPPYNLDSSHKDWLGIYTRDQDGIKDYFRNQ